MQTEAASQSRTQHEASRPTLRLNPTAHQPSQVSNTVQVDEDLDVLSIFKEERRMKPKQHRPRKTGTGLYRCHTTRNKRVN